MKTKKELRKGTLLLRELLTAENRREKSHIIAEKVITYKGFQEANKVLLFASFKREVDTSEIFEAAQKLSKDIYYPKVVGSEMEFFKVESETDLVEGYRGIREPKANEEKQFQLKPEDKVCVIMPGAVFDREGNRIGYGGGYYDKYLHGLGPAFKLAVAFECQMVEVGKIVGEKHDIKPDCIVTEERVIEVPQKNKNITNF